MYVILVFSHNIVALIPVFLFFFPPQHGSTFIGDLSLTVMSLSQKEQAMVLVKRNKLFLIFLDKKVQKNQFKSVMIECYECSDHISKTRLAHLMSALCLNTAN